MRAGDEKHGFTNIWPNLKNDLSTIESSKEVFGLVYTDRKGKDTVTFLTGQIKLVTGLTLCHWRPPVTSVN